jgi:hypothetical protein
MLRARATSLELPVWPLGVSQTSRTRKGGAPLSLRVHCVDDARPGSLGAASPMTGSAGPGEFDLTGEVKQLLSEERFARWFALTWFVGFATLGVTVPRLQPGPSPRGNAWIPFAASSSL